MITGWATSEIFKIKNQKINKYSAGGVNPSWTKVGKTWLNEKDLKAHLRIVSKNAYNKDNVVIERFLVHYSNSISLSYYSKEF